MKTAIITFRQSFDKVNDYIEDLINEFRLSGIGVDIIETLKLEDELEFKKRLGYFRERFTNLIVLCSKNSNKIKELIAEELDTVLVENETALELVKDLGVKNGVEYSNEYALMPNEATIVPNKKGVLQGFLCEENEFSIAFLPSEKEQLLSMCVEYVLPYLETKHGRVVERLTLKCFGSKTLIEKGLAEIQKQNNVFKFFVSSSFGDCKIDLLFEGNLPRKEINEVVRAIVEKFKDILYAEYDVSLGERVFDLLKLRRVRISTAESFTGGRVASEIIKNNGASEFLVEGIVCYSNESKQKRLGVKKESLENEGAVSSRVAYEMALGLLMEGNCDIAVSTTGIAGPTGETETKPVGLAYIGIGLKDGIHSYKLNLTGTREEITETAKNNALFLVIKKLKNL